MSTLPMQAPAGIPWWMIPGAAPSGGLFGGGFFGGPAVTGAPQGSAPAPVMGPQGQTLYSGPMPSIPKSAIPQTFMQKLGNGLFGELPTESDGLFGDPQAMRKQQMMAMAAGLMSAPNGSTLGQAAGGAYLAANKAGNEYMEGAQRSAYMKALTQQQQMAVQEKQRAQALEASRAAAMAQNQGITPEALESSAMLMYKQGDVAGAEAALTMADNMRRRDIDRKNAETNAAMLEANLNGGQWLEGPNGLYFGKKDGSLERKASWPQFNPNTGGGKADPSAMSPDQKQVIQDQLKGQISRVLQWADGGGGSLLGSPKAGAAWDASVGSFFGTEDNQMRRDMDMLISTQLLDMAKYLKPMSNTDITFLQKSMPTQEDSPATKARWLREFAKRSGISLESGSVFDQFNLERPPGATPGASGSF